MFSIKIIKIRTRNWSNERSHRVKKIKKHVNWIISILVKEEILNFFKLKKLIEFLIIKYITIKWNFGRRIKRNR